MPEVLSHFLDICLARLTAEGNGKGVAHAQQT